MTPLPVNLLGTGGGGGKAIAFVVVVLAAAAILASRPQSPQNPNAQR